MIIEQSTTEEYGEGQPISESIDESGSWYEAGYYMPDREEIEELEQDPEDVGQTVDEIRDKVEALGDAINEILETRSKSDGEILVETNPVRSSESLNEVTATPTDLQVLQQINENVVASTGIVTVLLSLLVGLLMGLEIFKIWLRN